jgi:hypothetical protein
MLVAKIVGKKAANSNVTKRAKSLLESACGCEINNERKGHVKMLVCVQNNKINLL